MINGKIAGITLGGFAGFLILSKGISLVRGVISDVCEANKWKNYYKYGKDGTMVPPGYFSHTHTVGNGQEVTIEKDSPENGNAPQKDLKDVFKDSFAKAIKDKLDGSEAAEGPLEGQTEASEMCEGCCPEECDIPKEECPFNDTEKSVNVEEDEKNETVD